MGLGPIQQSQLQLSHPGVEIGIILALAHLLGHVCADLGDPGIIGMGLVGHQQVQLGVFLHFHAQLIQSLDGGVAGKEVLGTGAEGDDLETGEANQGAGNGLEVGNHGGDILRGAHGIGGDIGLEMAHAQVVGAVEHAAVGVAAAVDEVLAAFLSGSHIHDGAVKPLGDERFRRLGTEVAQEHHQGIAARALYFVHGFEHILLIFHRGFAFVQIQSLALAGGHDGSPAALGERNDEAVPGHRNDAQLDFRNVGQHDERTSF